MKSLSEVEASLNELKQVIMKIEGDFHFYIADEHLRLFSSNQYFKESLISVCDRIIAYLQENHSSLQSVSRKSMRILKSLGRANTILENHFKEEHKYLVSMLNKMRQEIDKMFDNYSQDVTKRHHSEGEVIAECKQLVMWTEDSQRISKEIQDEQQERNNLVKEYDRKLVIIKDQLKLMHSAHSKERHADRLKKQADELYLTENDLNNTTKKLDGLNQTHEAICRIPELLKQIHIIIANLDIQWRSLSRFLTDTSNQLESAKLGLNETDVASITSNTSEMQRNFLVEDLNQVQKTVEIVNKRCSCYVNQLETALKK